MTDLASSVLDEGWVRPAVRAAQWDHRLDLAATGGTWLHDLDGEVTVLIGAGSVRNLHELARGDRIEIDLLADHRPARNRRQGSRNDIVRRAVPSNAEVRQHRRAGPIRIGRNLSEDRLNDDQHADSSRNDERTAFRDRRSNQDARSWAQWPALRRLFGDRYSCGFRVFLTVVSAWDKSTPSRD